MVEVHVKNEKLSKTKNYLRMILNKVRLLGISAPSSHWLVASTDTYLCLGLHDLPMTRW